LWPSEPQVGQLAAVEIAAPQRAHLPSQAFAPTPAAPDVPAAVGVMIVASYAALIGAFALATARSAESIFAVTISALFVVVYFTVPRLFFRIEPKAGERVGFDRFMRKGLATLTGHSSGAAALVQMLVVPVSLTFAALAMGIAAAVYL
jgi:hypothetical protein